MLYRRRYSVTASFNDLDWRINVSLNDCEASDVSLEMGWSHQRLLAMGFNFAGSGGEKPKKKKKPTPPKNTSHGLLCDPDMVVGWFLLSSHKKLVVPLTPGPCPNSLKDRHNAGS